MACAQPENQRCHGHQNSRHTERPRPTVILDLRYQEHGEEGSKVNGPIECCVSLLQKVTLVGLELITQKRGDAWLDAAGAERDQCQTSIQTYGASFFRPSHIAERQHPVSQTVGE